MSYNYATYKTALAQLMVMDESDALFTSILPSIIDYAEQRCYTDLNLLATTVADTSSTVTANTRSFTLPVPAGGYFLTLQYINIATPAGSSVISGQRNSVSPASRRMIDYLYPYETSQTTPSVPVLYAMQTDTIIILGPAPDAAYAIEVIGTIRPTALSSANTTTILSTYFPQLLITASMVFASGYQKNFGSQADDPKMAVSWESQYISLLRSAQTQEVRKKYNQTFPGTLQTPPTSGGTT